MIDLLDKVPRRCLLSVIVMLTISATAAAAVAARVSGPSSSHVGAHVSFSAVGLRAGTYTMRLVKVVIPDHGGVVGTDCLAPVGAPTRAVDGRVRIAGVLPTRLACRSGAGPVEGHLTPRAGRYLITINRDERGTPYGGRPFLTRHLRLVSFAGSEAGAR